MRRSPRRIVEFVAANAGTGWTAIEDATPGVGKEKRRAVRDGLFAAGRIVNVGRENGEDVILDHCPERTKASLYLPSDPTLTHLRREPGADRTRSHLPRVRTAGLHLRRAPGP